ncbi:MAG: helix-turn-helix domain-containing protein [Muribaculaceae bacterium]|nr:helix-turn-helix domain-containing protein [Muribaculaceae bacterium]
MDMSKRIKERRIFMGFTQEELGAKLGLQKSAIAKYENGRVENIKRSVIANMAKVLDCSPAYLMGWSEDRKITSLNNTYQIELKSFPLLGEIACGKPTFANEERESYIMAGTDIKADFCLKAKGDSMINARILDGDIVFIKKQDIVENGEIAAVVVNNDSEATLKRFFYYAEKSMVILKAENPAYEDLIFINEELDNFHVLGKAVAFQSDVK